MESLGMGLKKPPDGVGGAGDVLRSHKRIQGETERLLRQTFALREIVFLMAKELQGRQKRQRDRVVHPG